MGLGNLSHRVQAFEPAEVGRRRRYSLSHCFSVERAKELEPFRPAIQQENHRVVASAQIGGGDVRSAPQEPPRKRVECDQAAAILIANVTAPHRADARDGPPNRSVTKIRSPAGAAPRA